MSSKVAEEASGARRGPGQAIKDLLGRVPRPLWWALLDLFVLTGFVITQPLLDVTGKAPDFFLFHRLDRGGILLLAGMITVVPTAALWSVQALVRVVGGERLRGLVHLAVVGALLCLLAMETGKKVLPLRGKRLALAALLVGAAALLLYHKWSGLKLWLRYLAPAPLLFAVLFATTSPTARLILPSRSGAESQVPALTSPGRPLPPVVMVFFDEFPLQSLLDSHGTVDGRVYPNFARFAGDATWYRNATGVSGWTPYAVPAMLTGRYPDKSRRDAAPVAQVYPENLFTLFGHYYNLRVSETVTELCPPAKCGQTGAPSGLGTVVKETAKLYKDIVEPVDTPVDPAAVGGAPGSATARGGAALFRNLGQNQPKRFDKFVSSISAGDPQPTLYFLHVLLPHAPWKYLPDGRVYSDPIGRGPVSKAGTWPAATKEVSHQRQLLQLAYTDSLVGKLIDRLKQQSLYDKSLVLMTADHGSGYSSAVKSRSLGGGNEPTLMWVPLFIKAPHQVSGRVDDRNWEHVDLLPTVADVAGLSIPWKVDGSSEVGAPKRQRTQKWWYETPGERMVRPGPPNWAKALHGVTDTLVRAHQNGERGFYQFGANADWVYRSPQQIGRVGGAEVTVRMSGWGQFKTVTPGSPHPPEIVVGQVTSGTPPPGSSMVVAINGKIGGTAHFYPPHEGERPTGFAAMVPDSLFTPGPGQRQIQLYLATRSGGQVTFQPARLSS
ncbi:MAG TPA: sulfatase-like hydrolase/transferase [Actinomycetes bacterium]|nr:sulfatase-like hydrolase/transferase [Actinomycetes bacterium]